MEISQNGNNTAASIEEQITLVVHGFVQVWSRFEETITREVAAQPSLKSVGRAGQSAEKDEMLFRVGTALNSSSSLNMGELSDALGVPLSTATRIIDTLVERGHIERFSDTEDRRVVRIRFTPKGLKLYQFIDGRITEHVRKLAAKLTKEEMASLVQLLTKLAAEVKQTIK
jgi:DNA-binding MarR family transcriptional regulator